MSFTPSEADQEIIELYRSGKEQDRNRATELLVQDLKAKVLGRGLKMGLSEEDATSAFHDAVLRLEKKVRDPKFKLTGQLGGFLWRISMNVCNEYLRKVPPPNSPIDDKIFKLAFKGPEHDLQESLLNHVEQLIHQLGKDCKQVLFYTFYLKLSMTEVAGLMNYKSAQAATNKKYKCLEKLRNET